MSDTDNVGEEGMYIEDDWCILADGGEEEIPSGEGDAEGNGEEEVVETDAEQIARITAENAELLQKNTDVNNEKSQMGRRVKELQDYQKTNDATVHSLQQAMDNLNKPKVDDDGYIDMTNPNVAKKTIQDEIADYISSQNEYQRKNGEAYDSHVKDLMDQNESLSADDKESIMKRLENQKENIFNDPLRSAQYNINIAKGEHYEELVRSGGKKNPHIKSEKAVGTGVGGDGTKTQSSKKVEDTPAEARLKDQQKSYKDSRGW